MGWKGDGWDLAAFNIIVATDYLFTLLTLIST